MEETKDIISTLADTPVPKLLVIAGLLLLIVGLIGKIAGKINPGKNGRIACVAFGCLLVIAGIALMSRPSGPRGRESHGGKNTNSTDDHVSGNTHTAAGTTPATGFRVIEAFLRADPFDYKGKCPATIKFSGRISVAGGGGTVTYRFTRSDGASAPVQTLKFADSGSQSIETTWQLGRTYSGWEAIEIIDPQPTNSPHAEFKIQCQ